VRSIPLLFSIQEDPIDRLFERNNFRKDIVGSATGNANQIGATAAPDSSERIFLPQRARWIDGYHLQNFFRRNAWKLLLKCAHLGKQTQGFVASEAISAEANIESKSAQFLERKSAVLEIIVAARRMNYMKSRLRSFERIEVAFYQHV